MTAVSIIIAAFQAQDFIGDAVGSALAQDVPLEIIVAPDEAGDYTHLARRDPRIRVLPGVEAPTGPGPARNRALAVARGDCIALLDADDLWSPDYLSRLLPLAEKAGVAFGRTAITTWEGAAIRDVRSPSGMADYATFRTAFASFHGVARRDPARHWHEVLAEDVLFDLESLALAGGRAPYDDAALYRLRQRPASLTRSSAFIRDIAAGYRRLVDLVESGGTRVPPGARAAVSDVFRNWAAMNARFAAAQEADCSLSYQAFVTQFLRDA